MYQLKTLLTTLLFSLIVNALCAQADLCDNCYIWEFTTDSGERDQTTRLLSNDIEDILSQYSSCKVLQRSRYAKLQEQINNEKAIQSLNGANTQIKTELKTIQAKRVIFGSVNRDFQGNVALRLSFENLQTSQVKSNTVFLTGDDYYNFEKRKLKLTAFINSFVNPDGKLPMAGVTTKVSGECDPQNMPYIIDNEKIKIEFCQCYYYYSNKVTCPLWITNKTTGPQNFGFTVSYGQSHSRLIIDYGKDYIASEGSIMSSSSKMGPSQSIPATKNGVPASITFDNVQTKSKLIELLEIDTWIGTKSFPDVPLVHGPPPAR